MSAKGTHLKTTALMFYKRVGGTIFQCLNEMRQIAIYARACDSDRHVWNQSLLVKTAPFDGGNRFPVRLFAHAFASNTVTHVLFNV